jgi:4-amino-4-deoxy-L-arabinose transferase-like glycosyltransferase
LRRLLSYEYLLEPIPGQPGAFRVLYLLLALVTSCFLVGMLTLWRRQRFVRAWPVVRMAIALAVFALALVACALAAVPVLSMRILVLGANLLAWLLPTVLWVMRREDARIWEKHRRVLLGQMDMLQPPLLRYTTLLLLGMHTVGLLALSAHYRWPLWIMLLMAIVLLSPQLLFSLLTKRWRVRLEALAPLALLYSLLAGRLAVLTLAKVGGYPHFFLPPMWDGLLNVGVVAAIALPWTFFAQLYAVLSYLGRERWMLLGIAAACLLLSFAWATYAYIHLRTYGVTGTDPYGYAQMAVDLVEHRLPVHSFPLVASMERLGVFPEAGVHLGYHLPFDAQGRAATVWPVGQSVLLAAGYWLAGETGLYLVTPILGILSLAALALLSWELLSDRAPGERLAVSAVAVLLLGTSYAQLERLVVPMADAAAQLFTTLTILCWMRAMRILDNQGTSRGMRPQLYGCLTGLAFGAAYLVRHTQLVLIGSIVWLVWATRAPKRQKMVALAWFAAAAWLVAVPDLLYHQWVMGHWLRPESLELRHFSLRFMAPMAWRMLRDLLAGKELLYATPFMLWGLARQWHERPTHFVLLSSWALAVLTVHLPYEALRLRDLLSIFPVLCFWTGYGVLDLWRRLRSRARWAGVPPLLRSLGFGLLLLALFLLRSRSTLEVARAVDIDAFGHLNAFQRAGFAQIGQDTEESAWIGATLNSGAVELHSGRIAFRPAVWRSDELYTFVDHAIAQGVPIYLLEDGLEMAGPVSAAQQRYRLQQVGRYDIPFYHTGGGSTGGRVPLYRIRPLIN